VQGRRPPWILVETELYRYPPSRHPGRFRKFWCLCVFFWYGLTTSMTFSQALGFPIHLKLATNKIPMFFLIAWLRKDRKKLELDTHTHTHTNPMDGRSLATTGIYKPCQQTHGWDMSAKYASKQDSAREILSCVCSLCVTEQLVMVNRCWAFYTVYHSTFIYTND